MFHQAGKPLQSLLHQLFQQPVSQSRIHKKDARDFFFVFLEYIWHIQAFSLEVKTLNRANNSNQIKESKTLQYALSGTELVASYIIFELLNCTICVLDAVFVSSQLCLPDQIVYTLLPFLFPSQIMLVRVNIYSKLNTLMLLTFLTQPFWGPF